jgi:Kef-type K+ transport system membrane component KefB/voltage-gated potassium channel Kch
MAVESALLSPSFAIVIIGAAVLAFIAKKTNQPPLIAYLFTGILIGPVFLNLVSETTLINTLSELGLGFLLFLIGIEMKIGDIKDILAPVTRIAILQTILQTALAFIIPYYLGFTMMETIVIALCTVFGATPVIVKLLSEKDELSTLPSKIDVGVLILQDIYLIVILALFSSGSLTNPAEIGFTLVKIVFLIGVIAVLSLTSSKYLLPKVFKSVAENKHTFFAYGITWAFAFITLAQTLGLSVEVGAFLAGLGLGQIPFNRELEERIRPLTDFFMIVFFSTIGLQLSADSLLVYWKEALIASIVLMIGNFLIMFYLIDREKFTPETSFIGSINMTQVSEFSLVVGGIAVTQGYIEGDILGYLSLMALGTMSVSTYLINYNQEIYQKVDHLLERFESEEKQDVEVESFEDHIVLIGYDETVKPVLEVLEKEYEQILIIDKDSENTHDLSRVKHEYIYGDFKHSEIRKAANLGKAELVISISPDIETNKRLMEDVGRDTTVFVKATNFEDAAELYDLGAHFVIIESTISSEKTSEYLSIFLEDEKLLEEEIEEEKERIMRRSEEE